MEELKKQILNFKDWDASKKGRALTRLKGDNLELFTGLPDDILQAALDYELSAGGCIRLLCSDWTWGAAVYHTYSVSSATLFLRAFFSSSVGLAANGSLLLMLALLGLSLVHGRVQLLCDCVLAVPTLCMLGLQLAHTCSIITLSTGSRCATFVAA